eukprot:7356776-Lingulodinium_polyedra.AAC.1
MVVGNWRRLSVLITACAVAGRITLSSSGGLCRRRTRPRTIGLARATQRSGSLRNGGVEVS